jgi:quinol monooxygenase YgiN
VIVVNAVIETDEETIATITEAIAVMEKASQAEAGCNDYTFSVELNNPTVLRITENWDSMEVLGAHFGTPHMATFQALLAKYPPKSVTAHFYEASEVKPPGS